MLQRFSLLSVRSEHRNYFLQFFFTEKTVPVNISILQPSFPSVSPQVYTAVIVHYESGLIEIKAVNQSSRCQIHAQCLPIHRYFRGNQMCTIRYTYTNPDYGDLSNSITNPILAYIMHTWFYVQL